MATNQTWGKPTTLSTTEQNAPKSPGRPPSRWPLPLRVLVWILGIPALLFVLLYARLLFGPLDVPFVRDRVVDAVQQALPPDTDLALGDLSLYLDQGFRPVLRIAPVTYTDNASGAEIAMAALNIGFSPFSAMIGQPGANITLVEPKLQVIQDLLGPRLARFVVEEQPGSDDATVRVIEGDTAYPSVGILSKGLQVRGHLAGGDGIGLRSDNDWLIYNMEASEKSLADLIVHAKEGRFSRLDIRDGQLEMLDPVYSLIREFDKISLRVTPGLNGRDTKGKYEAMLAGREITGTFERHIDDNGHPVMDSQVHDLDLAAVMPFLDDPDGMMALRGGTTLGAHLEFSEPGGKVTGGAFDVDLKGTQLRVRQDYFPVIEGHPRITWSPKDARFTLADTTLGIGQSSAEVSGDFVLGLDNVFGSTVAISMQARNVVLHPNDMAAPETPFSEIAFKGWSAPLYGALGIDQAIVRKPGVEIRTKGRIDMVRKGIGVEMEIGGEGASADDLKRLWPYFLSNDNRDWFVKHVTGGTVKTADVKFNIPVGLIPSDGSDPVLPRDAMDITLTGSDVSFSPVDNMAPVTATGDTRLKVDGVSTNVQLAPITLPTDKGDVRIDNAAIIMDYSDPAASVIEISGDIDGAIPALLNVADTQAPGAVDGFDAGLDPRALNGEVKGNLVSTISFGPDGGTSELDYVARGTVTGFSSDETIADRTVSDGSFTFEATPKAYQLAGTLKMDGLPAELQVTGAPDAGSPDLVISSTIDASEFKKFGFDVSDFLTGKIRFAAKPVAGGDLQLDVDLTDAALNLTDLGLSKATGVPGSLKAEVHQKDTRTDVSKIDLAFDTVSVEGDIAFDSEKGLLSAELSHFALSKGDSASASIKPVETGGYSVVIRGEQFDLKPMLRRYYALDQGSTGGPRASAVPQTIILDAKLGRALGFYSVTAYNLDLGLNIKGTDLRSVNLQTTFAEGNTVSITTNQTSSGHTMSVALNDAGTLLRFLNVYPRLLGGSGSLVMASDTKAGVDTGEIRLKDFSLVDEDKVKEILGNHSDSRNLIAKQNRLNFDDAQARFIRRSDRIEIADAVLDGGSIGGTVKGFIYTKERRYDLTGTYIPLFSLNNALGRIPILGDLLGNGLIGVTFAVRGDLDKPQFIINPASLLAPGVFRRLFEFRAKEEPRTDGTTQ